MGSRTVHAFYPGKQCVSASISDASSAERERRKCEQLPSLVYDGSKRNTNAPVLVSNESGYSGERCATNVVIDFAFNEPLDPTALNRIPSSAPRTVHGFRPA